MLLFYFANEHNYKLLVASLVIFAYLLGSCLAQGLLLRCLLVVVAFVIIRTKSNMHSYLLVAVVNSDKDKMPPTTNAIVVGCYCQLW